MIYFQILFALLEYSCWLTLYFLTEFYNLFKMALPLKIHFEYSLFVISDVLRVLSSSTKQLTHSVTQLMSCIQSSLKHSWAKHFHHKYFCNHHRYCIIILTIIQIALFLLFRHIEHIQKPQSSRTQAYLCKN